MGKKKNLRKHAGSLAEHVEHARGKAGPALAEARDKAAPYVADARAKAGPALAGARDKAAPYVADARDKAAPVIAEARDKAAPVIADARDKAAPVIADARDKAAPYVAEARGKAAPYVTDARDRISDTFSHEVVPALTAALAAVEEATEDARTETGRRGRAVAAALRGEVEAPRKRHRLGTLLVVLGLGGVAVAVAKKLGDRQPSTDWQSSYTPPPVATNPGAHRAEEEAADDVAASDPAEAASDAADAPHETSSPDNPVTEVHLDRE